MLSGSFSFHRGRTVNTSVSRHGMGQETVVVGPWHSGKLLPASRHRSLMSSAFRLGIVTDCPLYVAVNRLWPSFSGRRPSYLEQSSAVSHVSTVTGHILQSPQDSSLQALHSMTSPFSCRAREMTCHYGHVNRFCYLLTYLLTLVSPADYLTYFQVIGTTTDANMLTIILDQSWPSNFNRISQTDHRLWKKSSLKSLFNNHTPKQVHISTWNSQIVKWYTEKWFW